MSRALKSLDKVLRDSKIFSQTKALYSYLWIRADNKSGLSYPPKEQILREVNLTEKLFNQGIAVLKSNDYIRETITTKKDDKGNTYNINAYDVNYYD